MHIYILYFLRLQTLLKLIIQLQRKSEIFLLKCIENQPIPTFRRRKENNHSACAPVLSIFWKRLWFHNNHNIDIVKRKSRRVLIQKPTMNVKSFTE